MPHHRLVASQRWSFGAAIPLTVIAVITCSATAQVVNVPAQCNLYGAGHATVRANCNTNIGPGILPVRVDLPTGATCVEFHNVSGSVLYCPSGCSPANGPEGNATSFFSFDSLDGISGISTMRSRFFEGVFLANSEPTDPAPPSLSFTDFSFPQLSPLIAQHFFIGDGFTGTGTGSIQHFVVPPGATRLYLGFSDGFVPCVGAFSDNSGGIDATVVVNGITQQPASASSCPTGTAAFSVTTADTGSVSYQWQIETSPGTWATLGNDPMPMPCGGFAFATPLNSATVNIGVRNCPGPFKIRCIITDACASVISSTATLTLVPSVAPDLDGDCDVDGDDLALLRVCMSGAGVPLTPGCAGRDFNFDGDVDMNDFGIFQRCYSGAGRTPPPDCAN